MLLTGLAAIAMSSCRGSDRETNLTAPASSSPSPAQGSVVTESPAGSVGAGAGAGADRPVQSTLLPATPPTSSPTSSPSPQPTDDGAALIWAYLRSGFADAPWLGAIRQISVRDGVALLTTDMTPDGRGTALAGLSCRAVLGNDRVTLSQVVVGGAGGTTAATCRR